MKFNIIKRWRPFAKLKILIAMDWRMKCLLVESYIYLALGWYLKRLPFSNVAPSLGLQMDETTYLPMPNREKELLKISQAIRIMNRYTFWESQCLVQAFAAMKMLEKRGIESTLYLGTAREENGKLIAHAWLRSGPYIVTGFEGKDKFTIVGKFAKKIGGKDCGENST